MCNMIKNLATTSLSTQKLPKDSYPMFPSPRMIDLEDYTSPGEHKPHRLSWLQMQQ